GTAVMFNLYQTSASGEMDKLKGQIEREMQTILNHLADKMDTPDHPGHLLYEHIDQTYELAKHGEFLALKEAENNITGDVQNYYLNYFSDRKSTRLNSSHVSISYAVFCLKKKTKHKTSE